MNHVFQGKWITDGEFFDLSPRNVFHRELCPVDLPVREHRDRHILFRRRFTLEKAPERATLYITADDYYKLYLNGRFVCQGPAPAYHFQYGYNEVDIRAFLQAGENTIAVHTLYQGLVNRVWVSADLRHGLLCDLVADGQTVLQSDESFLTHPHTGYTETGTTGYQTQFLETYDSNAPEARFFAPDFDDSLWPRARIRKYPDYTTVPQKTKMLAFETIAPVSQRTEGNEWILDFGSIYVGYLDVRLKGEKGERVRVRCGQELNEDGSVRWKLRANCEYDETWILSGNADALDWFDYKAFRYASLSLPEGARVLSASLTARHYPFTLIASMSDGCKVVPALSRVWNLCVHSQKYGVQEVIQDCMEREKGFYVGDGCYTALTNLILTGDDSIVRKLIDDAFASTFITPGMVTCLDCAMMQEIAEYPFMLISLILWHYRLKRDKAYLKANFENAKKLIDVYREQYETDGLLCNLDKWCVVEWPKNFQDDYDVDIEEGKVCVEPHAAINAYYYEAIHCMNEIAKELGEAEYRDSTGMKETFAKAFYDREKHLFKDGVRSVHTSYIANVFAFAFSLCPDAACESAIMNMIAARGITGVSFFGAVPLLYGLIRRGRRDLATQMLADEGAWLRMLREGATTTFEGWGKDTKWNTSLFHLTMTDAAVFLSNVNLEALFE